MLINQQPYSLQPPKHGSRIGIPFGQRNVYDFYCILLPCLDIKCLWVYFPSIWSYCIIKKNLFLRNYVALYVSILEGLTCRNVLFNDAVKFQDYTVSVIDKWRHMDHWCSCTDRRKLKYSVKLLSQYYFIHQGSNIKWPGIKAGTPRWEAGY
jgi:hypothetical protein